jgi:hypothetical protein
MPTCEAADGLNTAPPAHLSLGLLGCWFRPADACQLARLMQGGTSHWNLLWCWKQPAWLLHSTCCLAPALRQNNRLVA